MVIKTKTTIGIITNKTTSIAYDCVVSSFTSCISVLCHFSYVNINCCESVSEKILNSTSAQESYTVPFMLVHSGKCRIISYWWQSSYGRRPPRCVGETVRPAVNKSHSLLQNTSCGYCHHSNITPAVLLAYWSPVERNWTLYDGDGGILDTERWHQNAD